MDDFHFEKTSDPETGRPQEDTVFQSDIERCPVCTA